MKYKPRIDWHKENLTLETIITDNYKTTQNVRRFFSFHLSTNFKFTRTIMLKVKNSVGKSLEQIIEELKL